MRKIIGAIAMLISLASYAQRDTVVIHDTIPVVVFVIEKTDTAIVQTLLYEGKKNRVKKASPGYYVYRQQVATVDGNTFQPFGQPEIIGALDEKRRPVKWLKQ
jgi:hypothetical protein